VERDHDPAADGAACFHARRWTILVGAALSQVQWRQFALAALCWLSSYQLYTFARHRKYSPAKIDERIHLFCETLIVTEDC
jgi:hypothetical protein